MPLIFPADLPGASELVIEDGSDLVKGNNALLECLLEDLGKPEVTEYHWTMSVFTDNGLHRCNLLVQGR